MRQSWLASGMGEQRERGLASLQEATKGSGDAQAARQISRMLLGGKIYQRQCWIQTNETSRLLWITHVAPSARTTSTPKRA